MKISEIGKLENWEIEEILKESTEDYKKFIENKDKIRNWIKEVIMDNDYLNNLFKKIYGINEGYKREFLIDCGNMGILFNFKDNKISTHT